MTNSKTTKKALFASALSLILCFAMLLGTTYAWFTDSVTSAGNKIQAGTLDIALLMYDGSSYVDISDSTNPIFGGANSLVAQNNNADTLWEPGKTQVAYFAIKNNGSLALKYKVALNVINESKDLYKVMQYAITPDAQQTSSLVTEWDTTNAKSVDVGINETALDVAMAPGATHYFALSVHMKEDAGNQYQGGQVSFDMTVFATQNTVESDSFGNQYDKDALYPALVANASELKTALTSGQSVQLTQDVTAEPQNMQTTEAITIEEGTDVTIDLAGNEFIYDTSALNDYAEEVLQNYPQLAETLQIGPWITVEDGASLTLSNGKITLDAITLIMVSSNGELNLDGVEIVVNRNGQTEFPVATSSIRVEKNGVINMHGGKITCNGAGICMQGESTFNMYGGEIIVNSGNGIEYTRRANNSNVKAFVNLIGGKITATGSAATAIDLTNVKNDIVTLTIEDGFEIVTSDGATELEKADSVIYTDNRN